MKFVKDDRENRRDYIFQKDKKTTNLIRMIIIVLVILVLGVVGSWLIFYKS